jgi:hypothetical protein
MSFLCDQSIFLMKLAVAFNFHHKMLPHYIPTLSQFSFPHFFDTYASNFLAGSTAKFFIFDKMPVAFLKKLFGGAKDQQLDHLHLFFSW